MEIIDFHIHPFLTPDNNLSNYNSLLGTAADDIPADMAAAGVSRFAGSVIKRNFTGFETLRDCNRDALALRERFGGVYIPGFQISPQFVEESLAEIRFAHENGVTLIGELVPYIHGKWSYDSEAWDTLLREIARCGMAVNLHTMDMEEMRRTAKRHPDIPFIFAHPGEYDRVIQHVAVMMECENVSLDISGTGILRYGMLTHVVRQVGADRVLFGSDYPIGHPATYVAGVLAEKLTDTEREAIFSGNAKRILGV